jgi:hypothetical protein
MDTDTKSALETVVLRPGLCSIFLVVLCAAQLGASRHTNNEFGLEVRFPGGLAVCPASSGGHPHGFYARLGGEHLSCGDHQENEAAMGIYASYNTSFRTSPQANLPCRTGSSPGRKLVDIRNLAIGNLRSVSCAIRLDDGTLQIFVAAQGGSWGTGAQSAEFRSPYIDYMASLSTRPNRARRDMESFRLFLSQTVIHHVVGGG